MGSRLPVRALEGDYDIISNLGVGSFGVVLLAKPLLDRKTLRQINQSMTGTLMYPMQDSESNKSPLVAIKILNRVNNGLHLDKEIKFILSIPSHPNLIQVLEIFQDSAVNKTHIVMESLNQNLLQVMNARRGVKFSSKTLKSILSQVLDGIKHIHKYDYFHRDIKPENILVIPAIQYYGDRSQIPEYRANDNYVVKLSDYGLGRSVNNLEPYTAYIATRWYRSPEILLRRKWYSKPADIWAFAVVAAEIINFQPLFPGTCEIDQISKILHVLGSPSLPDINTICSSSNYFVPLGGFWREAKMLASRLGLLLSYEPGANIYQILPNTVEKELADVIKSCLTWDPDVRPDAKCLSSMEYFKNTQVYERYTPKPKGPTINIMRPEFYPASHILSSDYANSHFKLKQLKLLSGGRTEEIKDTFDDYEIPISFDGPKLEENIYPLTRSASNESATFEPQALDMIDSEFYWNNQEQNYQFEHPVFEENHVQVHDIPNHGQNRNLYQYPYQSYQYPQDDLSSQLYQYLPEEQEGPISEHKHEPFALFNDELGTSSTLSKQRSSQLGSYRAFKLFNKVKC